MSGRQMVAATLVAALFTAIPAAAQQGVTLAGTGKKEAKKPFPDYTARARDVKMGAIAGTSPLDTEGKFSMTGLQPERYVVELVDPKGKVVCTEGPFDMTKASVKNDVVIDCNKVPTAWWVLAAAAAAGVTSGVTAGEPTTNTATPTVQAVDGEPASPAR